MVRSKEKFGDCLSVEELRQYDLDLRLPHLPTFIRMAWRRHVQNCVTCRKALGPPPAKRTSRFAYKGRNVKTLPL